MSDLVSLQKRIKEFRERRNWKQFHTPRNLAESLVLEASEVLEYFQWKNEREISKHLKDNRKEFSHELADVLGYLLLLADSIDVDLTEAFKEKMKINAKKYPVSKSKGKATKYNKL